jgi:hypothetical protein
VRHRVRKIVERKLGMEIGGEARDGLELLEFLGKATPP